MRHLSRLYVRPLSIFPSSPVDNVVIITLVKTALIFRKNLIKLFIHLAIHTSFINLRERRKNTDWTICSISDLSFFLCVGIMSAVFQFESKLEMSKELLKLWYKYKLRIKIIARFKQFYLNIIFLRCFFPV